MTWNSRMVVTMAKESKGVVLEGGRSMGTKFLSVKSVVLLYIGLHLDNN